MQIQRAVNYNGAPNSIRISNCHVELILTTDFGPRIMRYARLGSDDKHNLLATVPELNVSSDLGVWHIRGGHRLWHAPESIPRSYVPDNDPVGVEVDADGTVKLIQPLEQPTSIAKEMWVRLSDDSSEVTVTHRLTNKGHWAVPLAAWGVSVMNTHGVAIFPQEPYVSHSDCIDPAHTLTLWSYTSMADPRWMWGNRFITLTQDTDSKLPVKVGFQNRAGWVAYSHQGGLLVKRFDYDPDATYPDGGCNVESFTNESFLEIETLGPLTTLAPGKTISHVERWYLFPAISIGTTELEIEDALKPVLSSIGIKTR